MRLSRMVIVAEMSDFKAGWASATSQETHGEDGNLPKGPRGGPKPPEAASLRPHGSHTIRVAAWHLELHFGGPGRGGDTAARA